MNQSLQKKTDYNKDVDLINTVRACIFKGSTDQEMALYFFKCQEVGVHPLSKMICPVVFKDKEGNRSVSFISTIDFFRTQSEEAGDFAGIDEIEYPTEGQFEYDGQVVFYPEKAICRVYRVGIDRPFTGVARWSEFYPGDKKGHRWRQMPFHMLGKCAEAQARRLGWPKKLAKLYTEEEMERGFQALAEGNTSKKPNITENDIQVHDAPEADYSEDVASLVRPSEDEIKAGRLINEKQGYMLFKECEKAGVEPGSVAAAAKVKNIFWLTWQKSCKTNFQVMLDLVKNRPNSFSKFSKAAQEVKSHQTPGNDPSSPSDETPVVMGSDEFESLVASLALQAGIKLEDGLKEIVGVDHPGDVLPDDQSKVIDFLESKKETPGA